jgi:hypothetical protein
MADMIDSVVREIAVRPDVAWGAVSDITRIGEWSTECYRCEWDSDREPGVGSTFTGYYRLDDKEWSNEAAVVEWVPEQRVVWEVRLIGRARELFGISRFRGGISRSNQWTWGLGSPGRSSIWWLLHTTFRWYRCRTLLST